MIGVGVLGGLAVGAALLLGGDEAKADEPGAGGGGDEPGGDEPEAPGGVDFGGPGQPGAGGGQIPRGTFRDPDAPTRGVFRKPQPRRVTPPKRVPGLDPAPIDVTEIENNDFPTPGKYYQVKKRELFGGKDRNRSIAWRALATTGFEAAKRRGATDDEARAFASKVANKNSARAQYINLIQCHAGNASRYGTYGYGTQSVANASGMAIRLLPIHADNRMLMQLGQPLVRNIALGTPGDGDRRKSGQLDEATGRMLDPDPVGGRSFEYLMMPLVDLDRLFDSDGDEVVMQRGSWPDGASLMDDPPEVRALLMDVFEDGLEDVEFGCRGFF